MATEGNDDTQDIVVDDMPREDGLPDAQPDYSEADPTQFSASPELAQLVETLPVVLERLNEFLQTQQLAEEGDQQSGDSDLLEAVERQFAGLNERLNGLDERVGELTLELKSVREMAEEAAENDAVEPPETAEPESSQENVPSQGSDTGDIDETLGSLLLGDELCGDAALAADRSELLAGVQSGDIAAIGLASRLMLVQVAAKAELPPLLKEVGEAYYRWRPKNTDVSDVFEETLVETMHKRIADVGLRNSIEVVQPGDRYETSRHVTPDRGVEVSDVRGWAVMRENGKALTKANVGLR